MSGNENSGRPLGSKHGKTRGTILVMIKQEPQTSSQLVKSLGINRGNVWKHLKNLKAQRLIWVSSWEPNGTGYSPVYSFGWFADLPRPKGKTDAELSLISYRKNRAIRLAKKRAKRKAPTVWDGLIYLGAA